MGCWDGASLSSSSKHGCQTCGRDHLGMEILSPGEHDIKNADLFCSGLFFKGALVKVSGLNLLRCEHRRRRPEVLGGFFIECACKQEQIFVILSTEVLL